MNINGAPVPTPQEINSVLNNINSNAVKVYDMLNKCLPDNEDDESWWEWEQETVKKVLFDEYSVAINSPCWEKILATKTVCNNNACMFDWYVFNQVTLSLTGHVANFESLKTPSPGMIISSINSLCEIRSDIIDENIEEFKSHADVFGEEVVAYICQVLKYASIYVPIPSIAIFITQEMRKIISQEMTNLWPEILERYTEFSNDNFTNDIVDDTVCIQARRLLRAEQAALTF